MNLIRKDDIMKTRIVALIFPFIALIFEALPYGAVLNFANLDGEIFRETYSYFDLMPFGYANFAPLITALLTCVILCLVGLYAVNGGKKICLVAAIVSTVACVVSFAPISDGAYSLVGAVITFLLAASSGISFYTWLKADSE